MQNVIDKIEWMFAGLGGFLGWFFGGFDGFLYALVVFVVSVHIPLSLICFLPFLFLFLYVCN